MSSLFSSADASLSRTLSIYLDFVRVAAAGTVFLVHAGYPRFSSGWLDLVGQFGRDAVMTLFVLSGFIIAYIVDQKETNAAEYFLARLSRLWSVAIPALGLTIVLDSIGSMLDPHAYEAWWNLPGPVWWRIAANSIFVNELWFSSIRPLSNGPFWSLGYEFWYYVIFAAFRFPPRRLKWVLVPACLIVAGPRLLLHLPVWLFGAGAYWMSKRKAVSAKWGWGLLLVPIALYSAFMCTDCPSRIVHGTVFLERLYPQLFSLRQFIPESIVGLLLSIHIVGFSWVAVRFEPLATRCERFVRYLAGRAFVLYLFHFPILVFLAVVFMDKQKTIMAQFLVIGGTLGLIIVVGGGVERKKTALRHALSRLVRRLGVEV